MVNGKTIAPAMWAQAPPRQCIAMHYEKDDRTALCVFLVGAMRPIVDAVGYGGNSR